MKITFQVIVLSILFFSCENNMNEKETTSLSAIAFSKKINALPSNSIIDVRTPEEFSKGHLPNAQNIDWNNEKFDEQISNLDKSKPMFVYCLSGGRSSSAAEKMRSVGFKQVYELEGGILKWRNANLPETIENQLSAGISLQQFDSIIHNNKLVLIDFYADWCGPCKKMKPYLEEISKEMANKVIVIRINADDNQILCKAKHIDALPVLQLYKNDSLLWSNVGYIEKDSIIYHIK